MFVARRIGSAHFLAVLANLLILLGPPAYIRSNNLSESIAIVTKEWLTQIGVQTPHTVSLADRRRLLIVNRLTAACIISCSMAQSFAALPKPKS